MEDYSPEDYEPGLLVRWRQQLDKPDFSLRVVQALIAECARRATLVDVGPVAILQRAWADLDPADRLVVRAVYTHPWWPEVTGYCVRLGGPPPDVFESDDDLAMAEAMHIADNMDEPLGRYYDLLVADDEGVHWWGHGYRGLMEHPDLRDDAGRR